MIDFNKYVEDATRTESAQFVFPSKQEVRLMHAALGVSTEAGELLDAVKKKLFYNKPLDITNVREEIGDLMWYVAILCDACGFDLEEILARNIAKLRARYPEKFSSENAINRDLDAERKVLE